MARIINQQVMDNKPMSKAPNKVSVVEKIGYGFGDTASNIVFQSVMMFLAYFYTDIFGITAAAMGTLFLMVRIVDAVTDPIMGALADRTETKWGKFRPYLLWLSVPFALFLVLAFTTPNFSGTGKLIYAYITYSLMMVIYTAINIPYSALGGVITPDSQERVSLNSYRFFLATAAGVLIAWTTLDLVEYFGQGNEQKGFQLTMALFSILAVILFVACFLMTKERVKQSTVQEVSFKKDLKYLLSNDQWVIVAVLNFILLIPLVIRGSAVIYYLEWFAERKDLVKWFLTTGMVSSMIGAGFASIVTKRLSKVRTYMIIHSIIVLFSVIIFFIGNHQLTFIFIAFAVIQFFTQMGSPILWAMTADTVDYGEWKTGRRITGLIFSGMLFSLKMGMALGGAILGWLLAYFKYQGGAISQSPETVQGILIVFSIVPALFHVLLIVIVTRYKLDKNQCLQIRNELDNRKAEII